MKRSTRWFLGLFGVTALLGACVVTVAWLTTDRSLVRTGSVLRIELEGAWPDDDPTAPVGRLLGKREVTLPQLIEAIEAAAGDDRIVALELKVGGLDVGWAKVQEIRQALVDFSAHDKPIHAFLESGNDASIYLASAADRRRMMETGTLWLDGISAEVSFYAGTLDKIGVQADLEQVGEYKNAADVMTRRSMTAAHRESMESLVDGLYGELISTLADSLKRSDADVRKLVERGPFTARQAVDAGLLDAVGYEDESAADLDEALDETDTPRIDLPDYVQTLVAPRGKHAIAIVNCVGTIVSGESSRGLFGGEAMGSDTIARALRTAREDDGVDAIVLRIDSPGGSPVASDVIWHETMRAREAGVPVVVSMSDVAASGGYWIAAGADHVVAEPSTLTGSIGIFGGKYVTSGLDELLALHVEPIERGANSGFNSSRAPFSDAQRRWLRDELASVYSVFLERTAQGRGFKSTADVDRLARGRVWTGRQAKERGLVDELGGLREAIAAARRLAHVAEREPVTLRRYPRQRGLFELLFDSGGSSSLVRELARGALAAEISREVGPGLRSLLADASALARLQGEHVVAYTPCRVRAN